MNTRAAVIGGLLLAVVASAVTYVLAESLRNPHEGRTPNELADREILRGLEDLSEAVRDLDASMRSYAESSGRARTVSASQPEGAASERRAHPSQAAPPNGEIEKLRAAIESLTRAVAKSEQRVIRRSSNDGSNMWATLRQKKSVPPRDFKTMFSSDKEATQRMKARGYAEVINLVGTPTRMFSPANMQVNWVYPTAVVVFFDGYVSEVHFLKSKE